MEIDPPEQSQRHVELVVMVEVVERENVALTYLDPEPGPERFHRRCRTAGKWIARDVGGDEVGDLIPIEVNRRHGRRVLPTDNSQNNKMDRAGRTDPFLEQAKRSGKPAMECQSTRPIARLLLAQVLMVIAIPMKKSMTFRPKSCFAAPNPAALSGVYRAPLTQQSPRARVGRVLLCPLPPPNGL